MMFKAPALMEKCSVIIRSVSIPNTQPALKSLHHPQYIHTVRLGVERIMAKFFQNTCI